MVRLVPTMITLWLLAASGLAEFGSLPFSYSSRQAPYVPHQLIVHWSRFPSEREQITLRERWGITVVRQIPDTPVALLQLPETLDVPQALEKIRQLPYVAYAEPNFTARAAFVPNDPYYEYQWDLGLPNAKAKGIDLGRSWELSTGKGVVIAVIDTGIAYEDNPPYKRAPDLARTRFTKGYDFVNDDAHPNDDNGHGTHVAGTIAASANDGVGTVGIAFDATLMPLKALDARGEGTHFDIANALYYAARHGAQIVNMSFGSPTGSRTLKQAVQYAAEKGLLLIAAAGNEYLFGNPRNYPAAYDDFCLAVAATRPDDTRAYYSNTGSYIDLAAPGGDLRVDLDHNGYGDGILQQTFQGAPGKFGYYFMEGTSMAVPHVSAVAALLMAHGMTDATQVRQALIHTARDVGTPGYDVQTGWGVVDAWAALNYRPEAQDTPEEPSSLPATSTPSSEEAPPKRLRVADIDLSVRSLFFASEVLARVTITDTEGNPVPGARIQGLWTGLIWRTVQLMTDAQGQAVSSSGLLWRSGTIGFRVQNVEKEGWVYDPSLNAQMERNVILDPVQLRPPEITQVGPNYPNPFNPDTWIPYQLAQSADVDLHIYDALGRPVRRIQLGWKPAGRYQTPARAIHWDGTNDQGEPVASGVYFYRFRAGDFIHVGRLLLQR